MGLGIQVRLMVMEHAAGAETSHPQSRQSRALAEQVSPATT
jgi:hypothetical protein